MQPQALGSFHPLPIIRWLAVGLATGEALGPIARLPRGDVAVAFGNRHSRPETGRVASRRKGKEEEEEGKEEVGEEVRSSHAKSFLCAAHRARKGQTCISFVLLHPL